MFDLTGKMTPKENYLRLIKGDNPQYLCHNNVYSQGMFPDALAQNNKYPKPGESCLDAWGVQYSWPLGEPGGIPVVTEENKVIKDITKWDKYLNVPWPSKLQLDWTDCDRRAAEFDRDNYLLLGFCFTGLFELTHNLMGFEDALMAYVEEPEAMGELLDVLVEYKLEYLKLLIDHVHPDMIHIHDDWGSKKNLFMSPQTWRSVLKPRWARIYDYMHSRGVLVQHHADCVCAPIVEDMAEIGVDVWQGIIPQNDIKDVQKRLNGRMALQGGLDCTPFDYGSGWNEAEVRRLVRRVCDDYVPAGRFAPEVPNGAPLTPGIDDIIVDEMNTYGEHFFDRLKN
ncbi:Uroporphyrinogen decarboxylase (URO-D) [Sporobacter termitidis DSM 10068]|uniref:Uroporphyrinogen decarboxylase (URO-D) n=1 Tax=Sporobacter termitidis DSM 10068 TaxID=1123282 RepID=A0A1M5Z1W0_9FIRM|nr:uroporphyrinogen decarboxylase family protein [Sporobacter termitidis]SHI18282.1 Uroporphyrinogen decarboxylase (URO-D) [Sporobacter termitidis DSM 10068]